jgi:transposase
MTSLVGRPLPEALWPRTQPLLAPRPPRPRRRRPAPGPGPQLCRRARPCGPHSTPWSLLAAKELGCGPATTCWRRVDQWARAGVFEQLQALLDDLGAAGRTDLERSSVDGFSLRAVEGGT